MARTSEAVVFDDTTAGRVVCVGVWMGDLPAGAVFAQPGVDVGGEIATGLFQVMQGVGDNDRYPAWLFTRNLDEGHVWDDRQRCWTDEGFFSYDPWTTVLWRVVECDDLELAALIDDGS